MPILHSVHLVQKQVFLRHIFFAHQRVLPRDVALSGIVMVNALLTLRGLRCLITQKRDFSFAQALRPVLSMPSQSHADLATLAHLARSGSLDLTAVAFRVRTDLLVSSLQPLDDDIRSYTAFALAALPALGERDLNIIGQKWADWPHLTPQLKQALIERLPTAAALFDKGQRPAARPQPAQEAPPNAPPIAASHAASLAASLAMATLDDAGLRASLLGEAAADTLLPITGADTVGPQIGIAQRALAAGNSAPALALLARSDLRAADHAPFFLLASQVQQALILSGLEQLQKLQPHVPRPRLEKSMVNGLMESAAADRAGAFISLAEQVGGTPEFAAAMTLDTSRKLAGVALLAIGATVEDAVRFAIKLGDESSASVAVIFSLVETLRLATPATALRLVRAIGGHDIQSRPQRATRHVPFADPSGTPERGSQAGAAAQERRSAASPLQVVRKLSAS